MTKLDDLVAAINAAPPGPQVAAFFDYDGTLIDGYSAEAFYLHRLRGLDLGPLELAQTLIKGARGVGGEEDFESFLEMSLRPMAGRSIEELAELGARLFKHVIAGRLHTEVWRLAEAHRAMGHTIVVASSATRFQVEPMATELGADHALCTPVEVRDGLVTGRTDGPTLWGAGKARAVRALAEEHELDLEQSFAYANGAEDLPFLQTVKNPVAVCPGGFLRGEAEERGWPVLRCAGRGPGPGPRDVARTVAFYGGMAAALGTGVGLGLLNRSKDTMLEVTGSLGSDLGLALAGVDVKVVDGMEHLWSSRPCVFVFNHQSKLDPIILMTLLRHGFTGVAKKEITKVPVFGQLFQLAGVAFVDRESSSNAKEALEPAVAKVRDEGLSIAIAPEGTRSATPRLGRFKKGAFHIARQAGVPVVPIVIRNAGQVMWRGSQTLRAGTVEVMVLPPVDTGGWSVGTMEAHTAEVRGMFLDTLANWPGSMPSTEDSSPSETVGAAAP